MTRTEHTPAVLLRSIAYGEADRIVTLLTHTRGKISLIARGARKSQRRFRGALEPYALIEAEIALGPSDLGRLAQARVLRPFPGLLKNLTRITLAAAGLEIVREAIPERAPDPRLLPTIERYLERLDTPGGAEPTAEPGDQLRLAFALRILAIVGLEPNLVACGRCGRAAPDTKAALFDPALGALVCRACGGGPIKLSGPLRAQMARCATRSWDQETERPWDDAPIALDALDGLLARHLSHRLRGADLVAQVREVRQAYGRNPTEDR